MTKENGKRIRPYLTADLEWIEPIAKRYGEWSSLLKALTFGLVGIVEEPYAMAALYQDMHGVALAGLAEEDGIKPLIRLVITLKNQAAEKGIALHGHWKPGSWQERLAVKHGFSIGGEGFHILRTGTEN